MNTNNHNIYINTCILYYYFFVLIIQIVIFNKPKFLHLSIVIDLYVLAS